MLPLAFEEKMSRLLGAEYEDFLTSYDRPRNTGLRLNPLKAASLSLPFFGEPIPWEKNGYYLQPDARPGLHPYHDAGAYYLQEPSAMAPAVLLAPQPGERVLDLCAAPGGKTTQLAAMMQGQGLLVCNEINPKRARILSSNVERLAVENALVLNEHPAKLAQRFPACFDRILVDAPCSGEGMFRKEEAALTDWSQETVEMCAARQKEILRSAAQMLRPGGRLVYSTCTFSPEENEGVISDFLQEHRDFSVASVDAPWFDRGRSGWIAQPAEEIGNTLRLWPHRLRGEGHFAAVLQKAEGEGESEIPLAAVQTLPREIAEFFRSNRIEKQGGVLFFGDVCYLVPQELPELRGLKVLRAGLELGEARKGRFVPAHALALWLKDFPQKADYPADSNELIAYLKGQTLHGSQKGWTLVTVDGLSLGWAKGVEGILKNHYPKGLRRL